MQINAPSRETALAALTARTQQLIREGDLREAERVQADAVVLSRAPGENLYDMHRLARDTARSITWPGDRSVSELNGGDTVFFAGLFAGIPSGIALVVGLGSGTPALAIAGAVGMTALAGGYLLARHRIQRREAAEEVLQAIDRQGDLIRGHVGGSAAPTVEIDRKVFLAALQGQEARLAEQGDYEAASDLREVHQALAKLPGGSAEAMFQSLLVSGDRKTLDLVQGKCSGEIAAAVEAIAEVGKLVAPGGLTGIGENADSIVIGGVVLRKNGR